MLCDERNCGPMGMGQMGMPMTSMDCCPPVTCSQGPIMEPPRERCVQRNICHDVRHVCPINTRIINNHIFRHTYEPQYTCCEQNVVSNVSCGSCCDFV